MEVKPRKVVVPVVDELEEINEQVRQNEHRRDQRREKKRL